MTPFSDAEEVTASAEKILKDLGGSSPHPDDVAIIKYLCALVSNRAAKILTSSKEGQLSNLILNIINRGF